MTIGRRFIDLARSELNALLDKAAESGGDEADDEGENDEPAGAPVDLRALSDRQLMEEIERRARERGIGDPAGPRKKTTATPPPRPRREEPRPRATRAPADPIAAAYAALEVKPGSDFETVKKGYRAMMRKYHPDRHAGSPEKARAAHELAQQLTDAYKRLERHLRR